jgi:hypothetical protein
MVITCSFVPLAKQRRDCGRLHSPPIPIVRVCGKQANGCGHIDVQSLMPHFIHRTFSK